MLSRARGLSLIEILVVVAILAVLTLIAVLGVGLAGGDRMVLRESERMAALIELACERAELTGRPTGVHFATASYSFSYRNNNTWRMEDTGELRRRDLPKGVSMTLDRNDERLEITRDAPEAPQTVCYPSGEVEPFTATLSLGDRPMYQVSGDVDGRITSKARAGS